MAAETHSIVVNREGSLESFIDDVAELLGAKFEDTERYVDGGVWAVLGDYGAGIYKHHRGFGVEISANSEKLEAKRARALFEKLKALGAPMELWEGGFEDQIDRYDPPAAA